MEKNTNTGSFVFVFLHFIIQIFHITLDACVCYVLCVITPAQPHCRALLIHICTYICIVHTNIHIHMQMETFRFPSAIWTANDYLHTYVCMHRPIIWAGLRLQHVSWRTMRVEAVCPKFKCLFAQRDSRCVCCLAPDRFIYLSLYKINWKEMQFFHYLIAPHLFTKISIENFSLIYEAI